MKDKFGQPIKRGDYVVYSKYSNANGPELITARVISLGNGTYVSLDCGGYFPTKFYPNGVMVITKHMEIIHDLYPEDYI